MADHEFVFKSILGSNMSKDEKSGILDWIDKKTGGAITHVTEKADYGESFKELLKSDTEAFLIGGLIGAAEGAEGSNVPAAAAMAAGGLTAILASGTGVESHARNASMVGAALLGHHASRKFLYEKTLTAHGESYSSSSDAGDAVLNKAKDLGFGA